LNKVWFDLTLFSVTHGSGLVCHDDKGSKRINITVASGDSIAISCLVLTHVCLFGLVSNLEIKIVLRILVKHLPICSCSDFCDFLRACIAKSFNLLGSRSSKGESNTAQKTHELLHVAYLNDDG